MAVVIAKDENTVRIHVKGASEVILARCSQRFTEGGEVEALGDDVK